MNQKPLIEFREATLGYGQKVIVSNISFSVSPGDYLGIVGPNGAGKTTILRAILGVLKPIHGEVRVGGNGEAPHIGYVPQRDSIDSVLPYTVREVVMMGRYRQMGLLRGPRKEDHAFVRESLEHVQVQDLAPLAFRDLSGGQKQRVLIARALVSRPEVLILDEPTNGMDLSSRISILNLIRQLHDESRLTVIMVSHLLDDVANHARRIAIVERDFFQVGNVEEVLTSENLTRLYGMPVSVGRMNGNMIVLAGGHHANQ